MKNLENKENVKFNLSSLCNIEDIPFSRCDKSRKVKLPTTLSAELAEEIGIHIGDGYLRVSEKGEKLDYKYIICTGDEDADFFKNKISKLMLKLYNLKPGYIRISDGSMDYNFCSKALAHFKKAIGLPVGRKRNIKIPDYILNSAFVLDCIRGIVDTDGSLVFKKRYRMLHYYPTVKITSTSSPLIEQIACVLNEFGIKAPACYNFLTRNSNGTRTMESEVHVNGKDNLEKWMKLIGFSNPKHITKHKIWKKYGFVPSQTTIWERKQILKGDLDPKSFYRK